jgi:hypothetical protein
MKYAAIVLCLFTSTAMAQTVPKPVPGPQLHAPILLNPEGATPETRQGVMKSLTMRRGQLKSQMDAIDAQLATLKALENK